MKRLCAVCRPGHPATRLQRCHTTLALLCVVPQVILVGDLNVAAERRDAHSTYNFDSMYDKEVGTCMK